VTTNNNQSPPPTIPKNRFSKIKKKSVQNKNKKFLNKKK